MALQALMGKKGRVLEQKRLEQRQDSLSDGQLFQSDGV